MIKTEGIVLSEIRYKETSKILNVYTKELGKIHIMAKGAYRPKSQLIANAQPFSYNEYQLQKGRNFYYINQGDIINSFYSIREKIERLIFGSYILELIEKSTPDEEKNERLFLLLEKSLKILSEMNDEFLKFIVAFELKFVAFLGYRPFLNGCVNCHNRSNSKIKFSNKEGGIICSNCFVLDPYAVNVNMDIIDSINALLYIPFNNLDEVQVSDDSLLFIHQILEDYILFNIEKKEFNSLNILRSMVESGMIE